MILPKSIILLTKGKKLRQWKRDYRAINTKTIIHTIVFSQELTFLTKQEILL